MLCTKAFAIQNGGKNAEAQCQGDSHKYTTGMAIYMIPTTLLKAKPSTLFSEKATRNSVEIAASSATIEEIKMVCIGLTSTKEVA